MVVAFMGILTLFLPIISATSDVSAKIDSITDIGLGEVDNTSLSELKNISLFRYGVIYYNETIDDEPFAAYLMLVLMFLPGAGTLLVLLFASGKHPILMVLIDLGVAKSFWLDTKWLADTGLMTYGTHEWDAAYYIFPVCIVLLAVLAIWIFILKLKWKIVKKRDK